MLSKEQKDLLARMRADNAAAPAPFRTTGHWTDVNAKFDAWFNELGIGDVINQKYNEHFSGEPRQVEATEKFLDYMTGGAGDSREMARAVLAIRLLEWTDVIERKGGWRNFSWGMLTALCALISMEEYIRRPCKNGRGTERIPWGEATMVDIGAGWGRVGYALYEFSRAGFSPYRYIICDLPESLLISLTYLPVMVSTWHGKYDEMPERHGCYYLPAHRILDLPDKSADVIVNIASFQEMPHDYVKAYFDIIDKKGKYLYTLQRGRPDNMLKCPAKPHWKLLFSRHPLWSDRHYEAMFEL